MSTSPVLDVAVPVYNEERELRGKIHELTAFLTAAPLPPWRVTIADNGSTDATAQLARELADEDARVRLVRVGGHEVIGGLIDGKRILCLSRPHVPDARQGQRPVREITVDRAVGRENKGIIVRRGGLLGHFVVVDMRIQILQHLIRPFPGKMLRSPRGRR